MKHTHILFVILAIILYVLAAITFKARKRQQAKNKNDLQYVNMDGLRRELADIRSTSFENLDIKNCAFLMCRIRCMRRNFCRQVIYYRKKIKFLNPMYRKKRDFKKVL